MITTPMRDARDSMSDDEDNIPPNQRPKAASQACETCRTRKVKCDEERPRCGVCVRLNAKCEYREPKPTKKDKTLVYVLEVLKSIDLKVDTLLSSQSRSAPGLSPSRPSAGPSSRPALGAHQNLVGLGSSPNLDSSYNSMSPAVSSTGIPRMASANPMVGVDIRASWALPDETSEVNTPQNLQDTSNYGYVEIRKLLTWPTIRQMLAEFNTDFGILNGQWEPATKWLNQIADNFADELSSGAPVRFTNRFGSHHWDSNMKVITPATIEEYTSLFFSSYHCMYPILDEDYFRQVTIPGAADKGFDSSDPQTTLILLVMALGEVAREGVTGQPLKDEATDQHTGVRGGDKNHPPGLSFLQEATKMIGQFMTRLDVSVLHCLLLFAIYYAQVSRNRDYWRMTVYASQLCKDLIQTVDHWESFQGDLVCRAHWMCVLLEGGLVTELGMPPSGISEYEMPFPKLRLSGFSVMRSAAEGMTLQQRDLVIKYHFLAQITLRAQINRINDSVNPFRPSLLSVRENLPSSAVTIALLGALSEWRSALPAEIQWTEDEFPSRSAATSHITFRHPPASPADAGGDQLEMERQYLAKLSTSWSFTGPFQGMQKITANFNHMDVVLDASLRTRYKYANYLIWRPYLYKVLHCSPYMGVPPDSPPQRDHSASKDTEKNSSGGKAPQSQHPKHYPFPYPEPPSDAQDIPVTADDVRGALEALKACTLWSLAHPVFKDQRRLLPHLYEYSHSMFGILLLFLAAERNSLITAAYEAAERGPIATAFPSSGFGSALGGNPAFGGPSGGAFGSSSSGGLAGTNIAVIQQEVTQMGAMGQLEKYRFLRREIEFSKECFLGWLRDMQVVHPIANWCWCTLKTLYGI